MKGRYNVWSEGTKVLEMGRSSSLAAGWEENMGSLGTWPERLTGSQQQPCQADVWEQPAKEGVCVDESKKDGQKNEALAKDLQASA